MVQDAPCFVGVLPKPTLEIGKVDYYVEAMSRQFEETLTQEYDPIVVENESDCEGILAPFLDKAKVIVGSAAGVVGVPQGFAASGLAGAGVSGGLVTAGVVGAGAAVAGVVVAGGGEEPAAPPATNPPVAGPPPAPAPTPAPPPAPGPTPTPAPGPTPTPAPGPTPTPTPGPTPVPTTTTTTTTTTTMPPNQPPNAVCNVSPTSGESPLRVRFDMCGSSDPDGDTLSYSVVFGDGGSYAGASCNVSHRYTAPEETMRFFTPVVCVTDGHPGHEACQTCSVIRVEGDDFRDSTSKPGDPGDGPQRPGPAPTSTLAPAPTEIGDGLALGSQLTVAGATGQIVLNGVESFFVGPGWTRLAARGRPETNRVEALLVDAEGAPGQWRFDLSATSLQIHGLRVVAGQTVSISPREVVFALSGRPGERVVFSLQLSPAP
jgi:hypothetical protein